MLGPASPSRPWSLRFGGLVRTYSIPAVSYAPVHIGISNKIFILVSPLSRSHAGHSGGGVSRRSDDSSDRSRADR